MITDRHLLEENPRNEPMFDGVQRIYRVGRYGLSLVNSTILHSYPFAWEAAVIDYGTVAGERWHLTYETPLTSDVEVFSTDDEANEFINKALDWFEQEQAL